MLPMSTITDEGAASSWPKSPLAVPLKHGRFEGQGTYHFENGDRYEGEFKDGHFHGKGCIFLKAGGQFTADWKEGIAIEGTYTFPDGLRHQSEQWQYCSPADRRFQSEILPRDSSEPNPSVVLTNGGRTTRIPVDTFDVGDGYLEPKTGSVKSYDGRHLVRTADRDEIRWAIKHCRKGVQEV